MTESDWNGCNDPQVTLEFLRGKGSKRKLRLFACACCRRAWGHFKDTLCRQGVEVAEQYADRRASRKQLSRASYNAAEAVQAAWASERDSGSAPSLAAWASQSAVEKDDRLSSHGVFVVTDNCARLSTDPGAEAQAQSRLLRDVFGPLPFRPVTIPPPLLSWDAGTVVQMAEAIYEERILPSGHLDPARLAVLADALEEAGCQDRDLFGHCREHESVHVRGCWVVDLILERS